MSNLLDSVPSVPPSSANPIGSNPEIGALATPSLPAPGASTPDKVSSAASAAPKLAPAGVVGAAAASTTTIDAAVKAKAIQANQVATNLADMLSSKPAQYQDTVWKALSPATRALLTSGGYQTPEQTDLHQGNDFWHTIVHGLDTVRHGFSDVGNFAKDTFITQPSRLINAVGRPLTQLLSAQQMTTMQGDMANAQAGRSAWSLDSILHQFDVASIIHNYDAISSGTAHFQPEALLYVQKELGITGPTLQLLKTYVLAGGHGTPALTAALQSVPANERASAASLILQNTQFENAAALLGDSQLSVGQMIFGGLNPDQMKQLYPKFDATGGNIAAQFNQANLTVAAAGAIVTGNPEEDVALLPSLKTAVSGLSEAPKVLQGLQAASKFRTFAAGGVAAAGLAGIAKGDIAHVTPDAATWTSPFGFRVNPLSGMVDGTWSWYSNPIFVGQKVLTEYKAGLHGVAGIDGWSQTRALNYYNTVGAGRRFTTTFAKAITSPVDARGVASEIPKTPNFSALERAGIPFQNMQEMINSAYPDIVKEIQAGGDGSKAVATMMASDQAAINVARGNAGMFFRDNGVFPHITVPQDVVNRIKGIGESKLGGERFNVKTLSPRQLSSQVFGQALTDQGVAAARANEGEIGSVKRFWRTATVLSPKPFLNVSDTSSVELRRLLGFSLPQEHIDRVANYYDSIPAFEISRRRDVALSGIKDMLIAAGVDRTTTGEEWLKGWLNRENYAQDDLANYKDTFNPDAPTRPSAIMENQFSNTIALPHFADVYTFAKKAWFMSALEHTLNIDAFDSFMSKYWKRAMLLRPGFAIRVATEEVLSFMLRSGSAAYINARIAASLMDAGQTMKELRASHELLDQQEVAAALGNVKAANELDVARLRDALTDHIPPEVLSKVKTPAELLASVQGWHGLNWVRRIGLRMVPEHIMEAAYQLAKRGVLDSGYQEYIDSITGHGNVYLGEVPHGKEDSGLIMEDGTHLTYARTGILKDITPGESYKEYQEYLPHWQMKVSGLAGSKFGRAATRGWLNGGDDGARQAVIDALNGDFERHALEQAQQELKSSGAVLESARKHPGRDIKGLQEKQSFAETKVAIAQKKFDDHFLLMKNFRGWNQTRDGRVVATGQASRDEAVGDLADAIVTNMKRLTFTTEPQDMVKVDGADVPRPVTGPQPIRLPSVLATTKTPWKIGTRDTDRLIKLSDEREAYSGIPADRVRLFRAENATTAQEGVAPLTNPGRTWFTSHEAAMNRAGEDGEVYHIDVPVGILKKQYDYKGPADRDTYIADIQAAQRAGTKGAGKAPVDQGIFESGRVLHLSEGDPQANLLINRISQRLPPTTAELGRVDPKHVPDHLLVPETILKAKGPKDFLDKIADKGMREMVGRPLNWMSRQPIYTYNYALGLRAARDLITARGIEDVNGDLAHDIAMDRAVNETLPYIHNPQMKSYLSVAVRNLAPFWFAQEQFYKRWGRLLGTYPEAYYKLEMGLTGLKSVGFIYTDQYGKDAFVYPGSEAVIKMLSRTGVFGGLAVDAGFSGELGGMNPTTSTDSVLPIPSFGPLITVPVTAAAGFFPALTGFAQGVLGANAPLIDQNGGWPVRTIEQIIPSIGTRFMTWATEETTASPTNHTSGLIMSAMINAMAQLEAAGHGPTPAQQGNATAMNQYYDRVVNWGKNIILLRTLFGFISPATPNFKFADNGAGAVYQALLNTMSYADAQAEFIKLYPNATPDTIFASTTAPKDNPLAGSGTFVPATQAAGDFINANHDFFKNSPQLAPWTIPPAAASGLFNATTYTQEKGLNLRFPRSLQAWYQETKYAEGANVYYPLETLVHAAESSTTAIALESQATLGITQAQAQAKLGLTNASEQVVKDAWKTWSHAYLVANPVFSSQLKISGDVASARRNNIVQQLKGAIDSNSLPKGAWTDHIGLLMVNFDNLTTAYDSHTLSATQAKQNKIAMLQWGTAYVVAHPELAAFWNGVLSKQVPG